MTSTKSTYLALLAVLLTPMAANADLIEIEVTSPTSITVALSGALVGPAATNLFILFIDTPVPSSVTANWNAKTGDAMIGSQSISHVFSGYNNAPYGGSLQLRTAADMTVGDVLSGSIAVSFVTGHGMTQSMFDGGGVPVYWGRSSIGTAGILQGHSVSPTAVPEPGTLALIGIGLFGMGLARRRRIV